MIYTNIGAKKQGSSPEKKPLTKILVQDIPAKADKEYLELFFENDKDQGGGEIESVEINRNDNTAIVEFMHPEAVDVVMKKRPISMFEVTVDVEVYEPQPLCTVKVAMLPKNVTGSYLGLYFESTKKSGGDTVMNIDFVEKESIAYVTFENETVARRVAKKQHRLYDASVDVSLCRSPRKSEKAQSQEDSVLDTRSVEDQNEERNAKVFVRNIPAHVNKDMLEMLLENPEKKGGGPVKSVEINRQNNTAIVEFEEAKAVDILLGKAPIQFADVIMEITAHKTQSKRSVPLRTVEVTGLPDDINKEMLEMFFENEKRSGGGEVTEIMVEEGVAIITFASEKVAERVAKKCEHRLGEITVTATIHNPNKESAQHQSFQRDDTEENKEVKQPLLCTVKVANISTIGSTDTLQYYLENQKRSGGGDISKFFVDEKEDIAWVTFKDENAARRTVERKHTLNNVVFEISLYKPPKPKPCYKNRLIFKGVAETTTKECLFNFLEARSEALPSSLVYGEEDGTVMVTFESEPDFEKVSGVCSRKTLEGNTLTVSKVPISNCIVVSNLKLSTSTDTVQYYFENKKRSNGGDIEHVDMNSELDSCLVVFKENKDVEAVLKSSHVLDGQKLNVRLFIEELGIIHGDGSERRVKIPEPLTIDEVDEKIVDFIKTSEYGKDDINMTLKDCFAKVIYPEKGSSIVLECELPSNIPNYQKLAKEWKRNVEKKTTYFFTRMTMTEHPIGEETWDKVVTGLKEIHFENENQVALFVDPHEYVVRVAGYQADVETVNKLVKSLIKSVCDEEERLKHTLKVTLSMFKHWQIDMLLAINYQDELMETFSNLNVKIDKDAGTIAFEGNTADVQSAKDLTHAKVHTFSSRGIDNVSKAQVLLFQTKEVQTIVDKKLTECNIVAVYDANGSRLSIYSYEEMISACTEIITETLADRTVLVQKDSATILSSNQWKDFVEEIHKENKNLCILCQDLDKIQITATDDRVDNIVDSINSFLNTNTIVKEDLTPKNRNVVKLLETHHEDKLECIAKSLATEYVQIRYSRGNISVQGTKKGISLAKQQFYDLCNKVEKKRHEICRLGIVSYIQSKKGQENIRSIEKVYPVCITKEGDDDYGKDLKKMTPIHHESFRSSQQQMYKVHAQYKVLYDRIISTAEGDITTLDVDAIVNSVDSNLSLIGGLGKKLVNKGGESIAKECEDYIKRNGSMNAGEVFVSKAGDLRARHILHVVSPEWRGGKRKERSVLSDLVYETMEKANTKNVRSIAIPALGCGNFGFPLNSATAIIVTAIHDFFREVQDSTIQEVYFVDIKSTTVDAFNEAVKTEFDDVQPLPLQESHQSSDSEEDEFIHVSKRRAQTVHFDRKSGTSGIIPGDKTYAGLTVEVIKGNITKQQVDIVVNTAARSLNLEYGAVSLSILKKAGDSIQQELQQNYPNGLKECEIAITSGGNMKCTHILHGYLIPWNKDETAKSKAGLHDMIENCLKEAVKQNATSIAFPALGTGKLGFPGDVVAKEMFVAIERFIQKEPQSTIKDVRFVVFHKDSQTLKAFETEKDAWVDRCFQTREQGSKHVGRTSMRMHPESDGGDWGKVPTSIDFGGIEVCVKKGDITEAKTECIVNSSNKTLDLSQGAVSQALLKKCGDFLREEAENAVTQMKATGLAITSAPRLFCRHIIHIDADLGWKQVIDGCLKLAEDNRFKSLAFPALGTAERITSKESATLLMSSIQDFISRRPKHLKRIEFVIFNSKMEEEFRNVLNSYRVVKPKSKSVFGGFMKFLSGPFTQSTGTDQQTQQDTSTVHFEFYSLYLRSIQEAINSLEQSIDKDVLQTVVKDTCIKSLDDDQIERLQESAYKEEVEIDIQQSREYIAISGISKNVLGFKDYVLNFMRDVERFGLEKRHADVLKTVVQWYVIEITQTERDLIKYDPSLNAKIETAFKDQKPNVRFQDATGVSYVLDFNKMEEFPEENEQDVAQVIRRDLIKESTTAIPTTWCPMSGSEFVKVVPLLSTDPEYQTVVDLFDATSGGGFKIVKIDRIQNKTLYQQYQAKKQLLEQQNKPGTVNERTLWHGTVSEAVDSINAHGYNRSYCGKNATYYGLGVYFAVEANYSCRDQYSKKDSTGHKRLYLSKVLTGEYTTGDLTMRVAPLKPHGGSHAVYDSVVDDVTNPNMYVIFNDTQACPEYLVTCK